MKEIGSIFPLSQEQIIDYCSDGSNSIDQNEILYSLCREAIYDIANKYSDSNRQILLPAYTCQTVITPFEELGWSISYFGIKKSLHIDCDNLQQCCEELSPVLVLVHPYFGMTFDSMEVSCLNKVHQFGIKIIVDLTQCVFLARNFTFADYYVGSYRKWFPIPDGGFLQSNISTFYPHKKRKVNEDFVNTQVDAMYLRNVYFGNSDQQIKDISIRLSKAANLMVDKKISPHSISSLSKKLLMSEDWSDNQKRRINNYTYLFDFFPESEMFVPVCRDISRVTTAPLYFTIYAKERGALQEMLSSYGIYAPVIWPVENENVLINDEVRFIYEHLLAIPCDQRYDISDMERIIKVLSV